jgi:hypothetical protein
MGKLFYFCARNKQNNGAYLIVVFCTGSEGVQVVSDTEIKITCSNLIVLERNDDSKIFGTASNGRNWSIACPSNYKLVQTRPTNYSPVN